MRISLQLPVTKNEFVSHRVVDFIHNSAVFTKSLYKKIFSNLKHWIRGDCETVPFQLKNCM